ncbi:MAG: hypothetical protein ACTH4K_08620 [Serratia bockelmannii]
MSKVTLILLALMLNGCASWTYYQQRTVLLRGDVPVAPEVLMNCLVQHAPVGLAVHIARLASHSDGGILSFSGGSQVDIEHVSAGSAYTILGGPRQAGKAIRGVITTCAVTRGPHAALLV